MITNSFLKSRWGLNIIFLIFSIIILIYGLIGISSIDKNYDNYRDHIEAIDLTREAQLTIKKQFFSLYKCFFYINDSESFNSTFHEFSTYSTKVQDLLFNIRLTFISNDKLVKDISELIVMHKKITDENINYLVSISNKNKATSDILLKEVERDKIFDKIESITSLVKYIVKKDNQLNSNYSKNFILIALIFFVIFTILISLLLSKKIYSIHSELEMGVDERTRQLLEANNKIKISENKYKKLVEGSTDIIFSMDENFNILDYNSAFREYFQSIQFADINKINFVELLYDEEHSIARDIIMNKLKKFLIHRNDLSFKANFQTKIKSENREMIVKVHNVTTGNNDEIIVEVIKIDDDILIDTIIYEKRKFIIGNSLTLADELSNRITIFALKYLPLKTVKLLRIAVREVIINGIEHGNLGISFDEKSSAISNNIYFELFAKRKKFPDYKNKKIEVEYMIDAENIIYKITDEGGGYNHKEIFKKLHYASRNNMEHGRGLLLCKSIFNSIKFNERGNQVILIKKIKSDNL